MAVQQLNIAEYFPKYILNIFILLKIGRHKCDPGPVSRAVRVLARQGQLTAADLVPVFSALKAYRFSICRGWVSVCVNVLETLWLARTLLHF